MRSWQISLLLRDDCNPYPLTEDDIRVMLLTKLDLEAGLELEVESIRLLPEDKGAYVDAPQGQKEKQDA